MLYNSMSKMVFEAQLGCVMLPTKSCISWRETLLNLTEGSQKHQQLTILHQTKDLHSWHSVSSNSELDTCG